MDESSGKLLQVLFLGLTCSTRWGSQVQLLCRPFSKVFRATTRMRPESSGAARRQRGSWLFALLSHQGAECCAKGRASRVNADIHDRGMTARRERLVKLIRACVRRGDHEGQPPELFVPGDPSPDGCGKKAVPECMRPLLGEHIPGAKTGQLARRQGRKKEDRRRHDQGGAPTENQSCGSSHEFSFRLP